MPSLGIMSSVISSSNPPGALCEIETDFQLRRCNLSNSQAAIILDYAVDFLPETCPKCEFVRIVPRGIPQLDAGPP